MAKLLLGKEVNEALVANLQERTAALREKGTAPTLGIIRVGARPDDLSYEKGASWQYLFSIRLALRFSSSATSRFFRDLVLMNTFREAA